MDILLEVTPTEEQKAERIKEQKEQESKRRMAKEKEHEIQEKCTDQEKGKTHEDMQIKRSNW